MSDNFRDKFKLTLLEYVNQLKLDRLPLLLDDKDWVNYSTANYDGKLIDNFNSEHPDSKIIIFNCISEYLKGGAIKGQLYIMFESDFFDILDKSIDRKLLDSKAEQSISWLFYLFQNMLLQYYGIRQHHGVKYKKVDIDSHFDKMYKFIQQKDNVYIAVNSTYEDSDRHIVGFTNWLEEGEIKGPEYVLYETIISLLEKSEFSIPINSLVFDLNVSVSDIGLPKPFSEELIKNVINDNKDRFIFEHQGNRIRLKDNLTYYIEKLSKEKFLIKNFIPTKEINPGFIAFDFIGQTPILKEFEEYLKTRPTIYIASTLEIINDLISIYDSGEKIKIKSEFFIHLKSVLPQGSKLKDWLFENITISILTVTEDELKLYLNDLIKKLSPIFNLKNNPGNLFEFTLKDKLKKLQSADEIDWNEEIENYIEKYG